SAAAQWRNFADIDDILAFAQCAGASDIHLGVNLPPIWRLNGVLEPIWAAAPQLAAEETAAMADRLFGDSDKRVLKQRGHADFAYANKIGRFRVSVVRQRLGLDLVFRVIN